MEGLEIDSMKLCKSQVFSKIKKTALAILLYFPTLIFRS